MHESTRFLLLACVVAPLAQAQDSVPPAPGVRFAAPVRILAGGEFLGAGRLYPSPVVCDWNGDGMLDVVVGDLPGRVTLALGTRDDDGGGSLGAEKALQDRDGQPLKFHNW